VRLWCLSISIGGVVGSTIDGNDSETIGDTVGLIANKSRFPWRDHRALGDAGFVEAERRKRSRDCIENGACGNNNNNNFRDARRDFVLDRKRSKLASALGGKYRRAAAACWFCMRERLSRDT